MYIFKNIFVYRKLQKKKKKLEQNFFKKKMAEKKGIEIEKTAKNKKIIITITIYATYNMTYLCQMGSNEFFIIYFFVIADSLIEIFFSIDLQIHLIDQLIL